MNCPTRRKRPPSQPFLSVPRTWLGAKDPALLPAPAGLQAGGPGHPWEGEPWAPTYSLSQTLTFFFCGILQQTWGHLTQAAPIHPPSQTLAGAPPREA